MSQPSLLSLVDQACRVARSRPLGDGIRAEVGRIAREVENLSDLIRPARSEPVLRMELLKIIQAQHGN